MADSPTNPPEEVKPIAPPVEPPVEDKDQYFYGDLHKEPIKEIAQNEELPKEEVPEVKSEEKPAEPVKPEEKVEIKPEELAEEISTKVAEKLTPKEEIEVKDKYSEFFEKIQAEKGREPNWIELSQFLEEQAVLRVEEKQVEAQKAATKQKEEEDKASEAFIKRFNSQIDEELEELYKSGNLSAIKDANNPSDPGVVERKALFQAMLDANAKRATEGKDAILSIARIFYGGYYKKPNTQPAGAEAPVSMGTGTPAGGEEEQELDYNKDVHRSWNVFKKIVPK